MSWNLRELQSIDLLICILVTDDTSNHLLSISVLYLFLYEAELQYIVSSDLEQSWCIRIFWCSSWWSFLSNQCQKSIIQCIDNSRTGLDTSKNQCSAPAVTALKKLLTVSCLQLISTKELTHQMYSPLYLSLVVLLETSYYSVIKRK